MDAVKIRIPYGNSRGKKRNLSQGTYSWQRFLKALQVFFYFRTVIALSVQVIGSIGGIVLFCCSGQPNRTSGKGNFGLRYVWIRAQKPFQYSPPLGPQLAPLSTCTCSRLPPWNSAAIYAKA